MLYILNILYAYINNAQNHLLTEGLKDAIKRAVCKINPTTADIVIAIF